MMVQFQNSSMTGELWYKLKVNYINLPKEKLISVCAELLYVFIISSAILGVS